MTNIKRVNQLCLALVVLNLCGGFLLSLLLRPFQSHLDTVSISRISLLVSQAFILVPALIYTKVTKQKLFGLIRFRRIKPLTIVLVIALTYCLLPFLSLINAISLLFSRNVVTDSISTMMNGNLLIGLFLAAVIPAFVEDTVYRGVVYHTYRGKMPLKGILFSALIFGAMHMNFNQFCYAFILGIVMAFLLEATNTIVATMLMHFIFNGNSILLLYAIPKLQALLKDTLGMEIPQLDMTAAIPPEEMRMTIVAMLPVAILSVLLSIGLFLLIAHINGRLPLIKSWFKKTEGIEYIDAYQPNPQSHNQSTIIKSRYPLRSARSHPTQTSQPKILDAYLITALILCLAAAVGQYL